DDLGFFDLPLAALAKSRVMDGGRGAAIHSPERICYRAVGSTGVREGGGNSVKRVVPPANDPGLHLLMRLRDEAHRFAIKFHRKRRGKSAQRSVLDGIPGLGKKRRVILLRHFGSVGAVRSASLDRLKAVKGLPSPVAEAIFEKLH
ncbi:MAG: hypothetical protein GXP54_11465, partial [Deltaproteobacteria bacterium]|nr:hypothetical protein [Deltaproteobacteria bacterium]